MSRLEVLGESGFEVGGRQDLGNPVDLRLGGVDLEVGGGGAGLEIRRTCQ